MDKSNSEEIKYDYSKHKGIWLKTKSGKKIKLRQHVANVSKLIAKHTGERISLERKFVIKAYNEAGLNGIKLWLYKQITED